MHIFCKRSVKNLSTEGLFPANIEALIKLVKTHKTIGIIGFFACWHNSKKRAESE